MLAMLAVVLLAWRWRSSRQFVELCNHSPNDLIRIEMTFPRDSEPSNEPGESNTVCFEFSDLAAGDCVRCVVNSFQAADTFTVRVETVNGQIAKEFYNLAANQHEVFISGSSISYSKGDFTVKR